ncbi:hypothetical protein V7V80_17315 [Pseudomonas kermanshahensis]|jgi:hypothetical protein|uniref:DUF2922 domain-containing protein n=1 Tax=Pseudomonas kermanshahensis TaxID=2745482 RepID=A0ABU8R9R6_9PSED|nr:MULTISPECIES: hypothetical protein [Pseudomonas]ATP43854.1 hypothetical protein CR511_07165 [Pseudomonas putida]MBC3486225.1 hypothetical protein [Pseudomonas sp. SWRI50]MBC3497998.1 hypothetical protein [Pseudomonas sp. SWRI67]MBV4525529.1 hypothetical protein [Pseudomonas kermanshahensis]WEL56934.1 hypothetical protein PZ739_07110 [Pseudomonas kermanshahensis]
MKEWEVIFADQKGEPTSLRLRAEHCPSEEDAARAIRSHLFPVMDELDLNDFQDRAPSPTARWLKEQNGVTITRIQEAP